CCFRNHPIRCEPANLPSTARTLVTRGARRRSQLSRSDGYGSGVFTRTEGKKGGRGKKGVSQQILTGYQSRSAPNLRSSAFERLRRDGTHQQTIRPQRKSAKAQMKSSCPASLDTLKISVPPAVKLDVACGARPALDLNDFESPGRCFTFRYGS